MKLCIVSEQHISANPRVWKEADLFANNGYEVVIITKFCSKLHKDLDAELLAQINPAVEYKAATNITLGEVSIFKKVYHKLRFKTAALLKKMGVETKHLVSESLDEIYEAALKVDADLYIAHVECGMYVGKKLIGQGKKVVFDFEDWHSEDYLVPTRPTKYLSMLEDFAVKNGVATYCPSESMAKGIAEKYNAKTVPQVIYNGFPVTKDFVEQPNDKPVLVWFSQTVGPGRGLEKFFKALAEVELPVVVRVIGNCNEEYKKELEALFPVFKGHQLELVKPVKHNELHRLLCSCDIGLALEQDYPASRNTTITNKILQYLQAGLKVFATDTLGQKEVAKDIGNAIGLAPNENVAAWPNVLTALIQADIDRKNTIKCYNELYSFDAQHEKLLNIVKTAFEK